MTGMYVECIECLVIWIDFTMLEIKNNKQTDDELIDHGDFIQWLLRIYPENGLPWLSMELTNNICGYVIMKMGIIPSP